jgi:hypothetical protein
VKEEELKWALLSIAEPVNPLRPRLDAEPTVEIARFIPLMHNYFYDQLRIEAKADAKLEDMLYKDAEVISAEPLYDLTSDSDPSQQQREDPA